MATLRELLAAQAAGAGTPVPQSAGIIARAETGDHPLGDNPPPAPQPPVLTAPRKDEYIGRQDGTEPIPDAWPPDDADFCTGNDLVIIQNPHLESFIGIRRPGKPLLYLCGPFPTINFPF